MLVMCGRLTHRRAPEPVAASPGTLDTMPDHDDEERREADSSASDPAEGAFAGTKGWSEWVRRNFSAESRLRSSSSTRRSRAGTASDGPGQSAEARSAATRAAVNGLEPRERRLAIVASVAELGLVGVVVVPYLLHGHQRTVSELKTLNAVHVFLIEGLVLGAFLVLGTIVKRRALVGFSSLLVGAWLLEIKALLLIGLAYLGFGVWLVMNAFKNPNRQDRGSAREAARQPRPAKPSRAKATSAAGRSALKPNKRYTPPKAPSRPVTKKTAPARAEPPKR